MTTATREIYERAFRVTRPDHSSGACALVEFGPPPEGCSESEGIRLHAADLRRRAALYLRHAEDADACAVEAERQERERQEREAVRSAKRSAAQTTARRRRLDPFGFAPWATATAPELARAAVAADIPAGDDLRQRLAEHDPGAWLLDLVRAA